MTKLRQLRLEKGLSQMRLAQTTGIHPSNLSRLERGVLPAYRGWKARLAAALGVPPEEADTLFEQVGAE